MQEAPTSCQASVLGPAVATAVEFSIAGPVTMKELPEAQGLEDPDFEATAKDSSSHS